jgi:hypothetical protein
MSDLFPNITDFVRCKEKCFFCDSKLECRLTNFIGLDKGGVPLINAPLKDGKFTFNFSRTTPTYTVKAEGIIDIRTNAMVFTVEPVETTEEMPYVDNLVAKAAFLDLRPHVQLYCSYKKCSHQYTIAGNTLRAEQIRHGWLVLPFQLYYESFVEGKLWIQNDYIHGSTYIYSRVKKEANPLVVPLMDFENMGKKKVLIRIKTYATFS